MGCKEEEEAAILGLCWEKHLLSGIWCHARFSRTDKVNWITGHPVSLSLITDSQGELENFRHIEEVKSRRSFRWKCLYHQSLTVSVDGGYGIHGTESGILTAFIGMWPLITVSLFLDVLPDFR